MFYYDLFRLRSPHDPHLYRDCVGFGVIDSVKERNLHIIFSSHGLRPIFMIYGVISWFLILCMFLRSVSLKDSFLLR